MDLLQVTEGSGEVLYTVIGGGGGGGAASGGGGGGGGVNGPGTFEAETNTYPITIGSGGSGGPTSSSSQQVILVVRVATYYSRWNTYNSRRWRRRW